MLIHRIQVCKLQLCIAQLGLNGNLSDSAPMLLTDMLYRSLLCPLHIPFHAPVRHLRSLEYFS